MESRSTEYSIEPDAARRSILMIGGRCEGGSNFNLVPAECAFTIDRRLNPEEDLETEKRRIFDILDSLKGNGIDLEIDVLQEGESAGISEHDPIAQSLARNVEVVKSKKPEFTLCPGLLETRFYVNAGVPAFAYGPGLLSVSHGPNEFVKINEIYRCASIYALTAVDILAN